MIQSINVKPRKCKNKDCRKSFTPTKPLQTVCGLSCAIVLSKLETPKIQEKKWRLEKAKLKVICKKTKEYRKEAREIFQRWIRIRDLGKTCISCPTLLTDIRDYHGGHMYQANNYPQLLFDERAVNGQCIHCNKFKAGNFNGYRLGVQKRYGAETLLELEALADDKSKRVLTKEYYIEITNKYKNLVKQLEQ